MTIWKKKKKIIILQDKGEVCGGKKKTKKQANNKHTFSTLKMLWQTNTIISMSCWTQLCWQALFPKHSKCVFLQCGANTLAWAVLVHWTVQTKCVCVCGGGITKLKSRFLQEEWVDLLSLKMCNQIQVHWQCIWEAQWGRKWHSVWDECSSTLKTECLKSFTIWRLTKIWVRKGRQISNKFGSLNFFQTVHFSFLQITTQLWVSWSLSVLTDSMLASCASKWAPIAYICCRVFYHYIHVM